MSEDKYHFIGIGGIGMSGLARILLEKGAAVSGSDIATTPITEELKKKGAIVFQGQSADHIIPGMTVILSTDIKEENVEYQAAREKNCRIVHRSQMLRELMQSFSSLAVTGTHGKTTTSSLLAWVLMEGGYDPSFSLGGNLLPLNSNGHDGKGKYFVAEADESDGSFLRYYPHGAIVTNIGLDHMNYFKSEKTLVASFKQFMEQVDHSDLLFWCGDDKRLYDLGKKGVSYGFSDHCQLRCSNPRQKGWSSACDISFKGKTYPDVEIHLIGVHNILNATAVFGLAISLGSSEESIRKGLKTFGGVSRRCEKIGETNGVLFIDDYAHHPTEIKTTLEAIRKALPERRLVAVFQPHRYSRTKECLGTYGRLFESADHVIVTDIHSAGEPEIDGVTPEKILKEIQENSDSTLEYIPRNEITTFLSKSSKPQDVIVTLGAGNITKVGAEILLNHGQKK